MNGVLTTLILLIVTISMATVVFTYTSLQGSIFNSNLQVTQIAEEYVRSLQISASQPAIKILTPTLPSQKTNLSINYIVTFNIPNYSGNLILFPFLVSSYYLNLAYYDPGIVKYVSNPNDVGYINIVPITQVQYKKVYLNDENIIISQNQALPISGYSYIVPNNVPLNITYTANSTLEMDIWVIVNISGNLYRISYPLFPILQKINTFTEIPIYTLEGRVTIQPVYTSYYQYLQQFFSDYSQVYYLNGLDAKFYENGILNASQTASIAFISNKPSHVYFHENVLVIAKYLDYSPSVNITKEGNNIGLPPNETSNLPPYIPLWVLEDPILQTFKGLQWTVISTSLQPNQGSNYVFNSPTIFEGNVTFGEESKIIFNAPVIFEGNVNFGHESNIIFNAPVIFNGSGSVVTFGEESKITSYAPIIFNVTKLSLHEETKFIAYCSIILSNENTTLDKESNITSYGYIISYGSVDAHESSYIGTLHKIPPISNVYEVTEPSFYTFYGDSDSLATWFETLPNNYNIIALSYSLSNISSFSNIQVIISPYGNNLLNISVIITNTSGIYSLLQTLIIDPYSWYYINISLYYPETIIINIYSTSSLLDSIIAHSPLPMDSQIQVCTGNESFTQLFLMSSEGYTTTPNILYTNGYLSNDYSSLSSEQWGNIIVLYYYLVFKYEPAYQNVIYPTYASPSKYYNYALYVTQSIVGYV